MQEVFLLLAKLSIPILALLIPIIAITAHYVVQPVVQALTRLAETSGQRSHGRGRDDHGLPNPAAAPGLVELEQRMLSIERVLGRILEEQEFQRELKSGSASRAARVEPVLQTDEVERG